MDTRRTCTPPDAGRGPAGGRSREPAAGTPPHLAGPARTPPPGGSAADPDGVAAMRRWSGEQAERQARLDDHLDNQLDNQLDELARCLARMDAVMAMLEADLDRRALAIAALVDPFGDLPLTSDPPDGPAATRASAGTGGPAAAGRSRPGRAAWRVVRGRRAARGGTASARLRRRGDSPRDSPGSSR